MVLWSISVTIEWVCFKHYVCVMNPMFDCFEDKINDRNE